MKLSLALYCPGCETTSATVVDLSDTDTVQTLVEQIEDEFYCTECGGRCGGAYRVSFIDKDTRYNLPLWKGPIP
jgi:hypothetical protein